MSTALGLQLCAAILNYLHGLWDLNSWLLGSELWSLHLQRHLTHRTISSPLLLSSFLLELCDHFFFNFLIMFLSFCHPHSIFMSLTFMLRHLSSPRSRPVPLSLILLSEHTRRLLAVQTESSRMLAT